jgi:hypothetical protein
MQISQLALEKLSPKHKMIFQTAFLASLLSSAAALTTETTAATATATTTTKKTLKDFKKSLKPAGLTSLSATMEKHGLKVKPSTIDLETTTFDESQGHMRGLKMKDNFLSVTSFQDAECTLPFADSGYLVNYCIDLEGQESGVKSSVLIKVNKKENLAVELDYDGYGCKVSLLSLA